MKTALLVLSHRMKRCGVLNQESISRVNKAIEIFREFDIDLIISSGWAYKRGCKKCIGDIIRDYLVNIGGIERSKTHSDINSRDTVGDAYFIKKNIILPRNVERLFIVTSGYHVNRAKIIFNHFYSPLVETVVISSENSTHDKAELIREQNSLAAFQDTFLGVDVSNDEMVFQTLVTAHPYYNGEIYPIFEKTVGEAYKTKH